MQCYAVNRNFIFTIHTVNTANIATLLQQQAEGAIVTTGGQKYGYIYIYRGKDNNTKGTVIEATLHC